MPFFIVGNRLTADGTCGLSQNIAPVAPPRVLRGSSLRAASRHHWMKVQAHLTIYLRRLTSLTKKTMNKSERPMRASRLKLQHRGSKCENLHCLGITTHLCSEPRDLYLLKMVLVPQSMFSC